MKLPMIPNIREDEILYSYLLRLSHANGFDDLRHFLGITEILPSYGTSQNAHRFVRYDVHSDLYPLLEAMELPLAARTAELYRLTSLFPMVSLMSSRSLSSHRIGMLSRYRSQTSLITPLADVFRELKFCPQCREEDQTKTGEWYYRRSHQIPGVCVCHLHGCALHRFQGVRGLELDSEQPSVELDTSEKSLEYAVFAHDLLQADLQADVTAIASAIYARMKEQGYTKQTVARLQESMDEYAPLLQTPLQTFFRSFPPKSQCDMQTCIAVLLYLFGDVKKLLVYLTPPKVTLLDTRQTVGKYELTSPWREDLIELRCHSCRNRFLTTPHRIESGWGCPDCDAKQTDQDLFQRVFLAASHGDYDLISFGDVNHPIQILHRACGRKYAIRPRSFLEEAVRCPCDQVSSLEELRRRIETDGAFELIGFHGTDQPLELRHKLCGATFRQKYSHRIRSPSCRICSALMEAEQTFRQEIYDLVGNEYALVGNYKDRKTAVQIRHEFCGTVQTYKPQKFLAGSRCSQCHQRMTFSDFCRIVDEVSYGVYTVDQQINTYAALIRNTQTNAIKKMPITRIMQELFRFKPSSLLPLEKRNLSVVPTQTVGNRVLNWLRDHYAFGESFCIKQIDVPGMEHEQLSKTVQNLYRSNKLEKISYGVYRIPPEKEF